MSPDIYSWLVYLNVIENTNNYSIIKDKNENFNNLPSYVVNFTFNDDGTINLSDSIQQSIYTGSIFPKIFSKINVLMNKVYGNIYKDDETLLNVVNDNQAPIKLHNFDLISISLKNYYGISLEDNFKTLLVAGDNATFTELFNKIYKFYEEIKQKVDKDNETKFMKENKEQLEMPLFEQESKELPKIRFNEDIVDLEQLASLGAELKPLNQSRSCLEFIIICICKSFSLNPKQGASLLNDNKKYLGHILKKGISQNYEPVKMFYQEVLANIDYFVQLIQINSIVFPNQISKNIFFSLNCFKFGLVSKSYEIVSIASRLLSKLALELIENNLISAAWDWFISPEGGMEYCYLCNKKYSDSSEVVVALINNFARLHFVEFFSVYLKNYLNNDEVYLDFISDLLLSLSKLSNFNDEFSKNLKSFFMEYALETSRSANINEKEKTCVFVGELWRNFSIYFDNEKENYQLLSILKGLVKNKSHLIQICALVQLFRTLIHFASERNNFVSIIYKSLIFTFIEYHADLYIREIMLANFTYIFKTILSIPVGILTNPYVREISLTIGDTYHFNLNDVNFIYTTAKHPRFNVKDAVMMLDVLGKIFTHIGKDQLNDDIPVAMRSNIYRGIYFYKIITNLFTMILSRYLMHELGVEFVFKFSKFLIQTFCSLDKGLSDKIYINALILNVNPESEKEKLVFEEDIILNENEKNKTINFRNLMKMAIVNMVLSILDINNTFVNGIIKNLIISAELRHYEIYTFHNIGLSKMLSHFGKCHEIIYYYNVNRNELDVDKEHEIAMALIYDKLPQFKEENISEKKAELINKQKEFNKKYSYDNKIPKEVLMQDDKVKEMKELKSSIDKYRKERKEKNTDPFHERFNICNNKAKFDQDNIKKLLLNNIEILDLNWEEDRDLLELQILTKNYQSFFKELFTKYCGSVYHPIKGKNFNSIKEISDTISTSEMTKLFKEHNILERYITKSELLLLLTTMNSKVFKKKNLKGGILYNEFIEDFVQISYFVFTRSPFIFTEYSIAKYTEEMIKYFQREFPDNSLYYNPVELMSEYQKDICDNINDRLKKSNFIPIPKGFVKYLDTEIYFKYIVPDNMYFHIGETKKICLEIVDEILFAALGVHTLEGFAKFVQNYKIRPSLTQKVNNNSINKRILSKDKLKI